MYTGMTEKLLTAFEASGVIVDNFISGNQGTGESSVAAKMVGMPGGEARVSILLGYCAFQRSVLKRASEMGMLIGWAWILAHGNGVQCHPGIFTGDDDAMASIMNNTITTEYL